ncbi:MAG: ABC transporter ATP-binding protein [Candidatus Hodarchaeales archaeon]
MIMETPTAEEDFKLVATLNRVTKAFGQVVAVSDVSFAVPNGSIMGFLGPNGSGKTTSIRLLLGLIRPQQGVVHVFGRNPFTDTLLKQQVGYVPEVEPFPRWIKAESYLTALGRYQLPREVAKRRAREVLEQMDLGAVGNKRIKQFSKGMKQRMKIAQALLHKPRLVIADEPFNGLDPVIRRLMFDVFEQYNTEYNTTFLVSSHILFEVEKLADQIVLLYKGRTIAQGNPLRIRAMLQEQPHSIQISTPSTQQLASLLIQHGLDDQLLSSIEFQRDKRTQKDSIIVLTQNPGNLYHLLTDLVVDHSLIVHELRATDEGLENLFKTLTVG